MSSHEGQQSPLLLSTICIVLLGAVLHSGSPSMAGLVELDPATGNTGPDCGMDGKCNPGICAKDPDCPKLPSDLPPPTPRPAEDVHSPCGGTVHLEAEDSALASATNMVSSRFPNFNAAQKSKAPHYFDAHPSGSLATNHGEVKGFGVTMVQGKWPNPIDNASGSLTDPSLLFFHKNGNNQDKWEIIGMGYSFAYDRNVEAPPLLSGIPPDTWVIHEAGYHHSPGDGGFTCATNDDLKRNATDEGKEIDREGCIGISKQDLKTKAFDVKHGRIWTVHIWFNPHNNRPTIAVTDPWCRQGSKAVSVPDRTFFERGNCS